MKGFLCRVCTHPAVVVLNDGLVWPRGHRLSPLITWRWRLLFMVRGRGIAVCMAPLPWGLLLWASLWEDVQKQMLPHDFWVFLLMMSSTRLSFNPLMEVHSDLKSMGAAAASNSVHHKGAIPTLNSAAFSFFMLPCPCGVKERRALRQICALCFWNKPWTSSKA